MDILRTVCNNIKHKIIGIQERQNIVLLNEFDLNFLKNREAKENMEGMLTDYSEYMRGLFAWAMKFWCWMKKMMKTNIKTD